MYCLDWCIGLFWSSKRSRFGILIATFETIRERKKWVQIRGCWRGEKKKILWKLWRRQKRSKVRWATQRVTPTSVTKRRLIAKECVFGRCRRGVTVLGIPASQVQGYVSREGPPPLVLFLLIRSAADHTHTHRAAAFLFIHILFIRSWGGLFDEVDCPDISYASNSETVPMKRLNHSANLRPKPFFAPP